MSTIAAPRPASALRLLDEVRRRWTAATVARGLAWTVAAVLATTWLLVALDIAAPLPASARLLLRWIPPAILIAGVAYGLARVRRGASPRRFALLAQEHAPDLQNRLATAVDIERTEPGVIRDAFLADLERSLARLGAPRPPGPAVRTPLAIAAVALGTAALGAWFFPDVAGESLRRWAHPADAYPQAWRETRAEAVGRAAVVPPPPFGEIRWSVRPPAYAGLPVVRGRGEEPVLALPGSRLELRSHFSSRWDAVRASGGHPVAVRGAEWSVAATVDPETRGVTMEALAGGEVIARRTVPIALQEDRPPDVRLTEPATDLVLGRAAGRIPVAASATDDLGVASLALSWSRTRGSGETFEYVDGTWALPGVRPGPRAAGRIVLDVATMGLEPGDVVHIRAVARDRNDVTNPGESVSRTRTIRIARPEELDQVNTDVGFPIELPENPLLSQRMIVIRTERLRDRARALGAVEVRRQATELAREQARLRERVGEQVFTRATGAIQDPFADLSFTETGGGQHAHDEAPGAAPETPEEVLEEASEATGRGTADEVGHRHDATPILEVNRTLQRIYDLMWASERSLNQSEMAGALPHQYEALRLIQEVRRMERRFPRGAVAVYVLDIAAARGTGELEGAAPAPRSTGPPVPSAAAALGELERAAAALPAQQPRVAALALSTLASRLLGAPGVDASTVSLVTGAADAAAAGDTPRALALLARARLSLAPAAGPRRGPTPAATDPTAAEYFRRLGRTP